jgi:hypothetical protein
MDKMYKVGFEVLPPVVMKSFNFWDMNPCRPSKRRVTFTGLYSVPSQKTEHYIIEAKTLKSPYHRFIGVLPAFDEITEGWMMSYKYIKRRGS